MTLFQLLAAISAKFWAVILVQTVLDGVYGSSLFAAGVLALHGFVLWCVWDYRRTFSPAKRLRPPLRPPCP